MDRSLADQRAWFSISATFDVPTSLLIRSSSGTPGSPDMTHLRSSRGGKELPIVSGTSLAGAVRARALRIANTVLGPEKGQDAGERNVRPAHER